jgi:hypothetical protein
MAPEVWRVGRGDGAQFDLYLERAGAEAHLFAEYIDPKNLPVDRRWHDGEIDLSPWAGQAITITFATGPGPNGNSDYDWAGWGEPTIVQPVAFDFLAALPSARHSAADAKHARRDRLTIDHEPRPILFLHPPAQVTYRVNVPERAGLHFGLGMDPAVWSPDKGDGVAYNLYVRLPDDATVLHRLFHHTLDPKNDPHDRHWLDRVVDLSPYGGQRVDLVFEALPGPAGDASYDWGGWSTPVLVANDMALLNPDSHGAVWAADDGP